MGPEQVLIWSAIVASVMLAAFCVLLFRRWLQERRKGEERALLAAITRSYLRRVAGQLDTEYSPKWSDELKLSAVSHIHLLLRGEERNRLMQMAELDGLLRKTLARSRSRRAARRLEAIRLLQQFGSEACVARLREIFTRDRNAIVRMEASFALAALHRLPPPRETVRILDMFGRKTNRLDSALLRASAKDYVEQLELLLADDLPDEKKALLVDALGWSENPSVLPLLEKFSHHANAEVRSAALRAAGKLGLPKAGIWVQRLLADPVPFVRLQAVNACVSIGHHPSVPLLEKARDDEDIWVRLRAEDALDRLRPNTKTEAASAQNDHG
ncbi:HEAT repeat domain-containing protein [Erythrobacter aureus]|uniref:HEAT repeat domain-containing protein n=1 Tax=Erythrobacter aureus TaxID=2182384 RepID=A0A345YIF4_9SPHN|nr:HEAT repeat domain-containing protein [Erythrobacter aureus]AXK43706.1 HEAT repeat domain-containing protein [Erythrobacter aureus]